MKILGIGNAIVDVICKVDDNFISQNSLTKSTMKLIFDDKEFKNLLSNLKIEKTVSGMTIDQFVQASCYGKINSDVMAATKKIIHLRHVGLEKVKLIRTADAEIALLHA